MFRSSVYRKIPAGKRDLHLAFCVRTKPSLNHPYSASNVLLPDPAVFGRELTEQLRADSKFNEKMVPLIVEKCIAAVDACGGPILLEIVSRH